MCIMIWIMIPCHIFRPMACFVLLPPTNGDKRNVRPTLLYHYGVSFRDNLGGGEMNEPI